MSLTINAGRGCHYLAKPGPGQAFLSGGDEGGEEGGKEKADVSWVCSLYHVSHKWVKPRLSEGCISKYCVFGGGGCLGHSPRVRKTFFLQRLHNMNFGRQLSKHLQLGEIKLAAGFHHFEMLLCPSFLPSSHRPPSPSFPLCWTESWPVPRPTHDVKQKAKNWAVVE